MEIQSVSRARVANGLERFSLGEYRCCRVLDDVVASTKLCFSVSVLFKVERRDVIVCETEREGIERRTGMCRR
jgi:hypothetical protein